jgi:hypothetical protein
VTIKRRLVLNVYFSKLLKSNNYFYKFLLGSMLQNNNVVNFHGNFDANF